MIDASDNVAGDGDEAMFGVEDFQQTHGMGTAGTFAAERQLPKLVVPGLMDFSPASIIGTNDAQRVGELTLMAGTGTPAGEPENSTQCLFLNRFAVDG
jgi:hypothetical protein